MRSGGALLQGALSSRGAHASRGALMWERPRLTGRLGAGRSWGGALGYGAPFLGRPLLRGAYGKIVLPFCVSPIVFSQMGDYAFAISIYWSTGLSGLWNLY